MRKFSRSIALLLCIVMVLGMLPATIFAAGGNNTPAFTLTTEDDIDFTNPDDASKFTILNKNSSAIQEGVGLKMITTTDAFEDCNGQVTPGEPADAVKVPVDGDWTATLKFDFSRGFAANGYYQFFGFYAAQGDDFQNLAGIRGGDGAMQNFLRVDGTITADSPDLNSTPGLVSVGTYWYRIVKAGTTYTCYRSADGEKFTEMFSYTDTGIEADSIIIDAYTGMTAGFTFTLKSLFFGETDPEGSEPPVDGSPLAGLEIPDADEIRGNITLVDEFNGETVTWTSSNPAVITDEAANGKAAGVVTRGKTDQEVTLTASAGGETKEIKVTVKAAPKEITEDNYAGYLFAHFIGERTADQEQIYFAVSEDGRHFTDMNDGEPVIRSTVGEMGLRDPYMYRSPEGDRFFIVATDLSIYHRGGWKINAQGYYDPSTTGSHYLVVYESTDLVDWGEPKWIKVAPENAGMAWAPEMIYHEESGQYIIFFASSIMDPETKYKAKPNAIYYVATRDFVNFSEPELLIDNQTDGVEEGGKPREIIDATIIKIGDWYYCAAKDGDNAEANGGIRVMKTQDLLDYTSWEKVYDLDELNLDLEGLTGLKNGRIDNSTLEGPEFFRFNKKDWADPDVPEYGLFADQYATGSGYLPIITTDVEDVNNSKNSWKILRPGEYSFDKLTKRHGTIVNLTQEELNRVKEAYANTSKLDGLEIPNADEIRGNITLVDEFNGEKITWTSSNPAVITDEAADGKAAGVVTRGKTDQKVTLTASAGGETKEIVVTVKAAPEEITEADYAGYLFAHFIGEGTEDQEQIYFAVSEDGRHFTDMNDGQPVIKSTVGEEGLRDPYMYRSPEGDRFFIVATDLSIYHRGGWKINEQGYYDPSTTGSHYLVVYESTDLVDWGEPKWIKVAPENAGMAWAPEMIYHEESGQYIIFFASSIMDPETKYKAKPNAIYYVATRDFVNFSEPELLIDNQTDGVEEGGKPREIIDATIIKIGDWYYCAAKDGDNAEANGGIRVMKTQDLLDYTSWEKVYDLDELNLDLTGLTGLKNGKIDNSTLEGPELFRFNKKDWANPNVPEYGLFADQYATGSGYLPIITTDLEDVDNSKNSWKILRPGEYSFDMLKKRHGTIVNLTQEELARVKEAYANSEQYLADKEAKKIANTLTIANSWNITEDIDLVTEKDGATITWTSSNPDVITINGSKAEVTRGASDQWVNLTATVKLGEGTATKSIRVRVLKADTGVHTITLDPNGGSVSETAIEVEHGKTASLPTPYRAGRYRFLGWFDKDGKQYTASTPITEDVTLTARWKYTGGGSHVDPVEPSKPVEPAEPAKPDTDFVDVKAGDWYEEAVSYVAENGLMTGVGNGKFNPDGAVTRAMVWTVLARMAGENTEGGSTWYAKAQAWAMETGVSDGTNPMGSITREQLATMLYRYEGSPAVSGSLNAYPDANQVSDWAVDAMIWATEEGIINGINGYLKPQDGATRAQLATMLMRWREQA